MEENHLMGFSYKGKPPTHGQNPRGKVSISTGIQGTRHRACEGTPYFFSNVTVFHNKYSFLYVHKVLTGFKNRFLVSHWMRTPKGNRTHLGKYSSSRLEILSLVLFLSSIPTHLTLTTQSPVEFLFLSFP